jgi:hypothetical protein
MSPLQVSQPLALALLADVAGDCCRPYHRWRGFCYVEQRAAGKGEGRGRTLALAGWAGAYMQRRLGPEAASSFERRRREGFFEKYLAGEAVLDIGYRGAIPRASR